MQNLAGEGRGEENNWDRRCIMEDAQIGANFPPPGLFWIVCSPARSLILTTCNNLTAKNHYSRVYNFVWGLECHWPVRIDGWCFSFGKVTYVVVTMAVDTNLFIYSEKTWWFLQHLPFLTASIFIASFCSLSFSPPLVAFLAVLTCLPRYLYLGAICWIKLSLWIWQSTLFTKQIMSHWKHSYKICFTSATI